MRSRTRSTTALVAALALFAALLVVAGPGGRPRRRAGRRRRRRRPTLTPTTRRSSSPTPGTSRTRRTCPRAAPQNLDVVQHRATVSSTRTSNAGGGLILAETIAGSIPLGRSTTLHPIDANDLRKVSFRMWADATALAGGFFWYTCDHIIPDCENGFPFTVQPGWHDYAFDIPAQAEVPAGGPAWAGTIKGIRLVPSGSAERSTSSSTTSASTPTSASDRRHRRRPSRCPVVDSPTVGRWRRLRDDRARRPVGHEPAERHRRAREHELRLQQRRCSTGINVGPNRDDAHFSLPLAGPIDGNRFHRLTLQRLLRRPVRPRRRTRRRHGRAPDLADRGRARASGRTATTSSCTRAGTTSRVDLATSPPWAITDPDTPVRIGWAGQLITAVRFDPHEDSGTRRFLVDNIKIAEDATGYGGAYDITFHDNAWQRRHHRRHLHDADPRARSAARRSPPASRSNQGVNTFHWAPNPLPSGHGLGVRRAPARRVPGARVTPTGPLRMTASPSPLYGVNPFGSLEGMTVGPGRRARRGAGRIDPDTDEPDPRWTSGSTAARRSASVTRRRRPARRAAGVPGLRRRARLRRRSSPSPRARTRCARTRSTSGPGATGCSAAAPSRSATTRSARSTRSRRTSGIASHPGLGDRPQPDRADRRARLRRRQARSARSTADDARPDIARALPGYGADHGYHDDADAPERRPLHLHLRHQRPARARTRCSAARSVTLPVEPVRVARRRAQRRGRDQGPRLGDRPGHARPDHRAPLRPGRRCAARCVADSSPPGPRRRRSRLRRHARVHRPPSPRSAASTRCARTGSTRAPGANTLLGCRTG